MENTIALADLFQKALDEVLAQALTTGWTEANAGRVEYNGGDTVKIAKMVLDGLADYSRANGYDGGDVVLSWETHTFAYDRGRMFNIDVMDINEANFVPQATLIMNEFVRTMVVPEVDMLRIARMGAKAPVGNTVEATDNVFADIKAGIAKIRDNGYAGELVAHIRFDKLSELEQKFGGQLGAITFAQGGVDTRVPSIDGVALIGTQSNRMVDKVKKEGKAYVFDDTGNELDILIVGKDVPLGIAKHRAPKLISPDVNQVKDGWLIGYRLYHDLFVEDNKVGAVYKVTKKD